MEVVDGTTQLHGRPIAYQTWGTGDHKFLIVPEWSVVGSVSWAHPGVLRSWRRFSRMGSCARFDRPGIGASALPVGPESTHPARWAEAARAVIDALQWDEVVIVSEGSAGQAVLLAAASDWRITRLIVVNGYLALPSSDGDPSRPSTDIDAMAEIARTLWGRGQVLSAGAPNLAADDAFMEFCARNERTACDAELAAEFVRSMGCLDVSNVAKAIDRPALVIHTGDLPWVAVEHCRELAAALPEARLELLPSTTFYGDPRFGDTVEAFALGAPIAGDRRRLAMLFTDVVGSTERVASEGDARWRTILEDLDAFTSNEVRRAGGRVVTRTGDGCLATFDDAAAAVRVGRDVSRGAPTLGVEVRVGVHVGEVEMRDDGDVAGLDVHIAARVAAMSKAGEVLMSPTVVDHLDTATPVVERGTFDLKGVPGAWRLFSIGA
jgi:class 3 adenylate cyclase/pimeloyl-ACP methyl ester carboxylesterase